MQSNDQTIHLRTQTLCLPPKNKYKWGGGGGTIISETTTNFTIPFSRTLNIEQKERQGKPKRARNTKPFTGIDQKSEKYTKMTIFNVFDQQSAHMYNVHTHKHPKKNLYLNHFHIFIVSVCWMFSALRSFSPTLRLIVSGWLSSSMWCTKMFRLLTNKMIRPIRLYWVIIGFFFLSFFLSVFSFCPLFSWGSENRSMMFKNRLNKPEHCICNPEWNFL